MTVPAGVEAGQHQYVQPKNERDVDDALSGDAHRFEPVRQESIWPIVSRRADRSDAIRSPIATAVPRCAILRPSMLRETYKL